VGNDIESFRHDQGRRIREPEQLAAILVRYFPQIRNWRQSPQILTDIRTPPASAEIQTIIGLGSWMRFPITRFSLRAKIHARRVCQNTCSSGRLLAGCSSRGSAGSRLGRGFRAMPSSSISHVGVSGYASMRALLGATSETGTGGARLEQTRRRRTRRASVLANSARVISLEG